MKRLTEPEQEELTPELDMCASSPEDLSKEVEDLRKDKQELCVQSDFGLERVAGSDLCPHQFNYVASDKYVPSVFFMFMLWYLRNILML